MGKGNLILMIERLSMMVTRLRIFVLVVCLFNFTACSAKNKTSMIANDVKERSILTGNHVGESTESAKSKIDSSEDKYANHQVDLSAVTDSVKRKATVNRRGIEKRDVKIDSITADNARIYGIVVSERSSSTVNSDETIDAFGLEVLLDVEDQQGHKTYMVRTDEMAKQETAKLEIKQSSKRNSSGTVESSEKSTPWLLSAFTTLITSWWFWVLISIAGIAIYKRVTGVNLFQVAMFKVKSWLS